MNIKDIDIEILRITEILATQTLTKKQIKYYKDYLNSLELEQNYNYQIENEKAWNDYNQYY